MCGFAKFSRMPKLLRIYGIGTGHNRSRLSYENTPALGDLSKGHPHVLLVRLALRGVQDQLPQREAQATVSRLDLRVVQALPVG